MGRARTCLSMYPCVDLKPPNPHDEHGGRQKIPRCLRPPLSRKLRRPVGVGAVREDLAPIGVLLLVHLRDLLLVVLLEGGGAAASIAARWGARLERLTLEGEGAKLSRSGLEPKWLRDVSNMF